MNFIMIGLLLTEALDRLCVRLNMYLVVYIPRPLCCLLASVYAAVIVHALLQYFASTCL